MTSHSPGRFFSLSLEIELWHTVLVMYECAHSEYCTRGLLLMGLSMADRIIIVRLCYVKYTRFRRMFSSIILPYFRYSYVCSVILMISISVSRYTYVLCEYGLVAYLLVAVLGGGTQAGLQGVPATI